MSTTTDGIPLTTVGAGNASSPPRQTGASSGIDRGLLIGLCVGLVVLLFLSLVVGILFIRRSYQLSSKKRRRGRKYAKGQQPRPTPCCPVRCCESDPEVEETGTDVIADPKEPPSKGHRHVSLFQTSTTSHLKDDGTKDFDEIDLNLKPQTDIVTPQTVPRKYTQDELVSCTDLQSGQSNLNNDTQVQPNDRSSGDSTKHYTSVSNGKVADRSTPKDCRLTWEYQYHNKAFVPDEKEEEEKSRCRDVNENNPVPPSRTKNKKSTVKQTQPKEDIAIIRETSIICEPIGFGKALDTDRGTIEEKASATGTVSPIEKKDCYSEETGSEPDVPMVSAETHNRLRELVLRVDSPFKTTTEEFSVVDLQSHEYEFKDDCEYSTNDDSGHNLDKIQGSPGNDVNSKTDDNKRRIPKVLHGLFQKK